jgi:protein JSN1
MRDFRKRLEGPTVSADEVTDIFNMIMQDPVTASADYIGNVVVQKLMEKGSEEQRLWLIKEISPFMATIGIHKNGTWAVQKMIGNHFFY